MSVDIAVPAANQPVQFSVVVSNVGTDVASGVVVTDRLPAELEIPSGMAAFVSVGSYDADTGAWDVGDLAPSASALLIIPAVVVAAPQPPCSVNVATTDLAVDIQNANNRAVAAVRSSVADRCVDLAVSGGGSLLPECSKSRHLEMLVRVSNAGPDSATNVLVDLGQNPALIPGLRFTGNGCVGTRCMIASLASAETVTLPVLSNDFSNKQQQTVTFNFSVSGSETDYATSNSQASASGLVPIFDTCEIDVGGVGGGGCFIATAAWGSPIEPHVQALRDFRDRYLARNALGRAFIRQYYRYSPPMAEVIVRHPSLRFVTRLLLTPLVLVIVYPAHAIACLLVIVLFGESWRRRRRALART